jgi:hypothetical protein
MVRSSVPDEVVSNLQRAALEVLHNLPLDERNWHWAAPLIVASVGDGPVSHWIVKIERWPESPIPPTPNP